jgi:alpha-beta hydrolase superfamily lysophospholipase
MTTQDFLYEETKIHSNDGLALALHKWRPGTGEPRGHVLILHGYMEHGGRYREVAHHLCTHGYSAAALDFRGHGHSQGRRGRVDRWSDYHDDVARALDALPTGKRFILAHSNGALAALDFVAQRTPDIVGLVVTNPFLAQTVPAEGLKLWVGLKAGTYWPALSLPSGLDPAGISHDPAIVSAYKRDPLVFGMANAAWFREVQQAQKRVRACTSIKTPLLYVHSDSDPIASPKANAALAAQLHSPDKTVIVRTGEFHEVLNEVERANLYSAITAWLDKRS